MIVLWYTIFLVTIFSHFQMIIKGSEDEKKNSDTTYQGHHAPPFNCQTFKSQMAQSQILMLRSHHSCGKDVL